MSEIEVSGPVRIESHEYGAVWRVLLDGGKANIIDAKMMDALIEVFEKAKATKDLRVVCLEGAGPNFSYGASVQEHLPGRVDEMLPGFHRMFRAILDASVVLVAAVRGRCLGGGLELATVCHRVFAAADAELGQPEILLGVFAPVASLILPARIGYAAASDLCLTGRSVLAEEAREIGLIDEIAAEPFPAALSWVKERILVHSAASLRRAVQALEIGEFPDLRARLDRVEALYLQDLMETHDAKEGIQAFTEKRRPVWRNE